MKDNRDDFELKDEYDFSTGIRGRFYTGKKTTVTLRLDDDLLLFFRKMASEKKIGYKTLLNLVLREYINQQIPGVKE